MFVAEIDILVHLFKNMAKSKDYLDEKFQFLKSFNTFSIQFKILINKLDK